MVCNEFDRLVYHYSFSICLSDNSTLGSLVKYRSGSIPDEKIWPVLFVSCSLPVGSRLPFSPLFFPEQLTLQINMHFIFDD